MNLLQVAGSTSRAVWVIGSPEARGIAVRNISGRFDRAFRLTYDLKFQSVEEVYAGLMTPRALSEPVVHIVRNAHLWEDSISHLKHWFAEKKTDSLIMESGLMKWQPANWSSKEDYKPILRRYVQTKFSLVNAEFAKTFAGRTKTKEFVQKYAGVDSWTAKLMMDRCRTWGEAVRYAQRVRYFPKVSDTLIESLAEETENLNFVHSLLQNKKADALRAPYSRRVFGDLAFSVDLVALMSRNQRLGESSFALAGRLNVHRLLVESHLPAVKFFDRSTMSRRLDCIAVASELWEQAENDDQRRAALVCLVALW